MLAFVLLLVPVALCHDVWVQLERPSPQSVMELTVGLKQRNLDVLKEIVHELEKPARQRAGKSGPMTVEKLRDLLAPKSSDVLAVEKFFRAAGAVHIEQVATGDFLVVRLSVAQTESLFGAPVYVFEHLHSKRQVLRAGVRGNPVPLALRQFVDVITGFSDFFEYTHEQKLRRSRSGKVEQSNNSIPDVLHARGDANQLSVDFVPYCENGLPATVGPANVAMCGSIPLVAVSVDLIDARSGLLIDQFSDLRSSCVAGGPAGIMCSTLPIKLNILSRLIIKLRTNFETWQSDVATYLPVYSPGQFVTPDVIYKKYNIPEGYSSMNSTNRQSVVGFEAQYINFTDLKSFQTAFGVTPVVPLVHGANDPNQPGVESTLDIQYVMGVGQGVNTTFWSVSGDVRRGAYILEWAMQISNTSDEDVPFVTSISYGDTELGFFNNYGSWDYIQRMEVELQKMAARHLTVMAGSGDAGCSNVGEAGNDLSPTDPTCTPFRAFYPSNSPYVTSVSATFLTRNYRAGCNLPLEGTTYVDCDFGEASVGISSGTYWTTGGGFSNLTFNPRPQWQDAAVQTYFSRANLPEGSDTGVWNKGGRGYPDVSAFGFNMPIFYNGTVLPAGGTSASGPALAGLVSLINDRLLAYGYRVGWLNPALYAMPSSAFFDVTFGRNADGDVQARGSPFPSTCSAGFDTAKGWDPVSGLGTPRFDEWFVFLFNWHRA